MLIPSYFNSLSQREFDKVGSLLHLISKESNDIYLTRLLKIMFLIDEKSVEEIGVPVTCFDYRIAENGPLIVELWDDLKGFNTFRDFVKVTETSRPYEEGYRLSAIGKPKETHFSEYELNLISSIIQEFKNTSTTNLIHHIHTKDKSLWKEGVNKYKINFKDGKVSKHNIDLKDIIKEDETLSDFYNTYKSVR